MTAPINSSHVCFLFFTTNPSGNYLGDYVSAAAVKQFLGDVDGVFVLARDVIVALRRLPAV